MVHLAVFANYIVRAFRYVKGKRTDGLLYRILRGIMDNYIISLTDTKINRPYPFGRVVINRCYPLLQPVAVA
jgi:hypothetical protein